MAHDLRVYLVLEDVVLSFWGPSCIDRNMCEVSGPVSGGDIAISISRGVLLVGVLTIRALLFEVYSRGP